MVDVGPPIRGGLPVRLATKAFTRLGGSDIQAHPWQAVQDSCDDIQHSSFRAGHVQVWCSTHGIAMATASLALLPIVRDPDSRGRDEKRDAAGASCARDASGGNGAVAPAPPASLTPTPQSWTCSAGSFTNSRPPPVVALTPAASGPRRSGSRAPLPAIAQAPGWRRPRSRRSSSARPRVVSLAHESAASGRNG